MCKQMFVKESSRQLSVILTLAFVYANSTGVSDKKLLVKLRTFGWSSVGFRELDE